MKPMSSTYTPQAGTSLRYLRNPDVILRAGPAEGGALLFNPDTRQVKALNATGWLVWQRCDGRTLDEIVAALVGTFEDAPRDVVAQDVRAFVAELRAAGFVGSVTPLLR